MPLDLAALSPQMSRLGELIRDQAPNEQRRLEQALRALRRHAARHDVLAEWAGEVSRCPFRAAIPRGPLDGHFPAPAVPDAYSVVATDGSQIEPDRHGPVLCYLINVGYARIRYGPEPGASLRSEPTLAVSEDDLYLKVAGGEPMLVQDRLLGLKRQVAETERLAGIVEESGGVGPVVGLQDGTLLLSAWGLGGEQAVLDAILPGFLACLDRLQARGVPLASYVSRPRGSDVVNLLRLATCREQGEARDPADCKGLPASRMSCGGLADFPDRAVFEEVLAEPGERSAIFRSSWSASRKHYGPHEISFFYLNVGSEVARVEVPKWVAESQGLLDLVHAVIWDQCQRGDGYPRSLIEAHEKAVVTAADRRLYDSLIENAVVAAGLSVRASEKERSKRIRSV